MPIQQLQPEFIRPIYSGTWAGKPSAAGNAGKEIIVTDFNRSRWYSDGTYWRPVGGEQVVHNPILADATASSATLQPVASVPSWQMPADLANTPSIKIVTAFAGRLISLFSQVQQRQIEIGISGMTGLCMRHYYTDIEAIKQGKSITWRDNSNGNYYGPQANGGASQSFGNGTLTVTSATLAANPIQMYYRGGNTDGSEVIRFAYFRISIGG